MDSKFMDQFKNLMGELNKRIVRVNTEHQGELRHTYQRFNVGDEVEFYDDQEGRWDTGRITGTRTKGSYTVQNPDSENFIVEWNNLRAK